MTWSSTKYVPVQMKSKLCMTRVGWREEMGLEVVAIQMELFHKPEFTFQFPESEILKIRLSVHTRLHFFF